MNCKVFLYVDYILYGWHHFVPGEKPYMCSVCGASFTHSSSLSVHKRSHTGVKPFVCEQCGAAFAVGSVLKQHMRKHSGEKPYKCGLCPSAFTQSTKLTIHMRKHTGEAYPLTLLCPLVLLALYIEIGAQKLKLEELEVNEMRKTSEENVIRQSL